MKIAGLKMLARAIGVSVIAAASAHSQTFQTLTKFNITDGDYPRVGVIQGNDGNFYGTTWLGGSSTNCTTNGKGCGTAFKLQPTGTLTTLYSFCQLESCTDGTQPFNSGIIQGSDGNFYGTTLGGGAYANPLGGGTIFMISPAGTFTTLYSFCALANCADGNSPYAGPVQGTDGNLYGTTLYGGLVNSSNCSSAGAGCGTFYKATTSGALSTLYSFCSLSNCADGSLPYGPLIRGNDGNFYGTTVGVYTIFKISPSGTETVLYAFSGGGWGLNAPLAEDSAGNLFGATSSGGNRNPACLDGEQCGTVFMLSPSGALTTLYNFCSELNCTDGANPNGGIILGADGNLYGTTSLGGTKGAGTVFQLTPAGMLTTLYSFCALSDCADGSSPIGSLIQTINGTFYGVTEYGGLVSNPKAGYGTVYSLALGVALAPTLTPTSLSFGNQAVDTTSHAKSVSIKNINTGSANLAFKSFSVIGSTDFKISTNNCGTTLAAGKICQVSLTYAPSVLGAESATLSIADNAPGSPQTVTLTGTGVAQVTLSPTTIAFGKTKVGTTSAARNVTLQNNLSTTLTGISYSTSGPFAVSTSTCGATLNTGKHCTISVTFTPTQIGAATGMLDVSDSANNSPQAVSLSGTGD